MLKALSVGGVSRFLPMDSLPSSYGRVALRFSKAPLSFLHKLEVVPKIPKLDCLQSMPPKLQKPSINSPLVKWKVSERDGSHTGEVVLCWGLVEQARHKHMSDDYKNRYIMMVPSSPSLMKVRDTTLGSAN